MQTGQGVHGQGKCQGKNIFSRSGNCQGILTSVKEFYIFSQKSVKCQGILKRQVYEIAKISRILTKAFPSLKVISDCAVPEESKKFLISEKKERKKKDYKKDCTVCKEKTKVLINCIADLCLCFRICKSIFFQNFRLWSTFAWWTS